MKSKFWALIAQNSQFGTTTSFEIYSRQNWSWTYLFGALIKLWHFVYRLGQWFFLFSWCRVSRLVSRSAPSTPCIRRFPPTSWDGCTSASFWPRVFCRRTSFSWNWQGHTNQKNNCTLSTNIVCSNTIESFSLRILCTWYFLFFAFLFDLFTDTTNIRPTKNANSLFSAFCKPFCYSSLTYFHTETIYQYTWSNK